MRIGFACKYMHHDRLLSNRELKEIESQYNMRTTTAKWCRDNPKLWQDRLWEIMEFNVKAIFALIGYVKTLPKMAQMVRISSDVLPLFTHKEFKHFYQRKDVERYLETHLAPVREFASGVKLSFHPGQFTVLASENPNIVTASIEEFEYHAYLAELMGYGRKFQDFKCNVHLSGKGGIPVFRKTYKKLSCVARNIITIENDEFGSGLDKVLEITDIVPIVLDIHHHWINCGEYIRASDIRVRRVVESWRGVRPTMHYSYSRSEVLLPAGHDDSVDNGKPVLLDLSAPRAKLRAHSDTYPNVSANRWALSFLPSFDIMCESKFKNLASLELIKFYKQLK